MTQRGGVDEAAREEGIAHVESIVKQLLCLIHHEIVEVRVKAIQTAVHCHRCVALVYAIQQCSYACNNPMTYLTK